MKDLSRIPWAFIVAVLAIAVVVYVFGIAFAFARVGDARGEALTLQQSRVSQAALRLEDYVGVTAQLAHVAAITVRDERDTGDVTRDVRKLLAAADRSLIYAVGVFYAPGVFNGYPRFGVYRFAATSSRDTEQIVDAHNPYDYRTRPWYTAASVKAGKPAFTGPYESSHGLTFVGTSETFASDGAVAGVVLVEALQSSLDRMVTGNAAGTDRIWVTDSHGKTILGTPVATGFDSVLSSQLRLAPWTLHVASSFPAVENIRRTTILGGVLGSIAFWALVALVVWVLLRVRGLQLQALDLQETAYRDALTGLRNRIYMFERLDRAIRKNAQSERGFGVLFVDLDRFAVVNDSLGHAVGDLLLQAIGARVNAVLPANAEFGRIGGDEFVTYVPGPRETETCKELAASIIERLSQPFVVDGKEIYISASIGVVLSAPRYKDAGELLRDADTAMYAAKHAGRGRFAVFDERMREAVIERHSLETALRRAVENREIVPRYQPIVSLRTGRVISVEALARWKNASGENVPPSTFIPLAEQSGIIDGVDMLILTQACADAARFARRFEGLTVSVNVSAARLNQSDLAAKIGAVIMASGLQPRAIKLELTETSIMQHAEEGLDVLNRLRVLGTELVIDDFGTGHSSLSYAQRLPVSGLKIDRSFIAPMARDRQSLAIVRAIVALAKTLGLYVVAEGVEEQEQVEKLREVGVDFAQGYYYAPALDAADLEAFVERCDVPATA